MPYLQIFHYVFVAIYLRNIKKIGVIIEVVANIWYVPTPFHLHVFILPNGLNLLQVTYLVCVAGGCLPLNPKPFHIRCVLLCWGWNIINKGFYKFGLGFKKYTQQPHQII